MPKYAAQEYHWIRKWGEYLLSKNYYIKDQQKLAAEDGAPLNAIFKKEDGTWETTDGITSEVTRYYLGLPEKER